MELYDIRVIKDPLVSKADKVRYALECMKDTQAQLMRNDYCPERAAQRRDMMDKLADCIEKFEAWLEVLE